MTEREARTDDVSAAAPALTRRLCSAAEGTASGSSAALRRRPSTARMIEGGACTGATALAFITVLAPTTWPGRRSPNARRRGRGAGHRGRDDVAAAPVTEREMRTDVAEAPVIERETRVDDVQAP